MLFQGSVVGSVPTVRSSAGSPNAMQLQLGEFAVSELLPRLYALGWSGQIFSASNQAAQAVSVGLAAAYTGLGIYNPIGSSKILVPLKVKFALSVAPVAVATIGLLGGLQAVAPTAQTVASTPVQSSRVGDGTKGVGIAVSAATIAVPTWIEQLLDGFTAGALPAPTHPMYLDGNLSVLPGSFLGVGALTAIIGLGSIFWAELPL